jgi:hypothetical protein
VLSRISTTACNFFFTKLAEQALYGTAHPGDRESSSRAEAEEEEKREQQQGATTKWTMLSHPANNAATVKEIAESRPLSSGIGPIGTSWLHVERRALRTVEGE